MNEFIYVILGYFAFTSIFIFGITSYIIYVNNRRKVFAWYSLYCFLIAIYLSYKVFPLFVEEYTYNTGLNWFIQTLFYNVYMRFGLYYLDYPKRYPVQAGHIFKIQKIVLLLCVIVFILNLNDIINILDFFIYFFLPYLIIITVIVLRNSWSRVDTTQRYFLYGSMVYTLLAMIAFYFSMNRSDSLFVDPVVFFFVAINLETFIFAIGLGQKIKQDYTNKIAAEQELNKLLQTENKNKALQLDVSELNNTVLRNQMNSHFVFNVLNSIKLFMMENDSEKAILYLSKFAKFMRKVLDANFYEDVTLHEELKAIDLYLSIELMRFDYSFSYHIDVSPQVDLHQIRLPAFILQPFIENVLWHGFMKKEGNKHLFIQVTKELNIIIEDNGIGRKAAKLFNNSIQKHKSHGLNIIQERLQFFNQKHHRNIWFEIIDLPKGTRIVIYFN